MPTQLLMIGTLVFFFLCVALAAYLLTPLLRMRADHLLEQSLKQTEGYLDSLYMDVQAKQVLYVAAMASAAGFLLGLLLSRGSLVAGALLAVAGYFAPSFYFKLQRKRRHEKLNEQIVGAIEMISNALRAGTNFTQALALVPKEMPAPIAQELTLVLREMELGLSLEEALKHLAQRVQSEEYDLVVTATNIARETGGNLAEVFDRIAHTIRSRNEVLGKIQAQTAEGKMQGIFVGALPLLLGAALLVLDPDKVMPMFTTPIGYVMLAAVLFLEGMGAYFIKKVITIDA